MNDGSLHVMLILALKHLRRSNAHHATKYMPPNLQFGKSVDSWPQLEMALMILCCGTV